MSKTVIRLIVALTVIVIAVTGLWLWRNYTLERMRQQAEADLATAWEIKDFSRIRLLAEHLPDPEARDQWLNQLNDAQLVEAIENNDAFTVRQLHAAEESYSEQEALLLARAAVHERDSRVYAELREQWQTNEQPAWVFLDVDALIVAGKIQEARKLLEQHQFSGRAESNRWLRLSILSTSDPRTVLRMIDESVTASPDHADALAFRGQVLESLGQWQAARADYVRAVALAPDSPLFWDQLAEFYRRRQMYAQAVDSWLDGYAQTKVPEFWIKAWFWRRVSGLGDALPPAPTNGAFADYAQYLASLPNDRWWNASDFENLPYASRIQQQRQETFWLRLLQSLQDEQETQALSLLRSDPFAKRSWAPRLKRALVTTLLFRSGEPPPPAPLLSGEDQHQFYQQLADLNAAPNSEFKAFLVTDNAWAAACLSEGWLAAAIDFDSSKTGQPVWYDYGQAQAQRQLSSVATALDRLALAKSDDASIQLLQAELQWLSGDSKQAVANAQSALTDTNATGQRAAMLLAVHYATNNQWDAVEELLSIREDWAATIPGMEMAARLALARSDLDGARTVYQRIEDESTEAKLFLSRLAYQNQDWAQARTLTRALIAENPDEPAFYRNLEAINQAEATP